MDEGLLFCHRLGCGLHQQCLWWRWKKICCFQLKEEAEMPIDQKEAEVPSLREEVALEGELLQVPALPNTYLYFIRMTMLRLMS